MVAIRAKGIRVGNHSSHRGIRGDRLYVPLFHPAAALYNASLLRTLEEDMQRVRGYLDDAEAERERQRKDEEQEAARAAAVRAADEQLTLF